MQSLELKRIDLWSLFKVAFVLYAAVGLVAGLFYAFIMMVAGGLESLLVEEGFPEFGIIGGALAFVLVPVFAVFQGATGAVFVTIAGFVYNIAAGMFGGIRINAEVSAAVAPPRPQPPPAQRPPDAPPAQRPPDAPPAQRPPESPSPGPMNPPPGDTHLAGGSEGRPPGGPESRPPGEGGGPQHT
jgi:hypothetical protein